MSTSYTELIEKYTTRQNAMKAAYKVKADSVKDNDFGRKAHLKFVNSSDNFVDHARRFAKLKKSKLYTNKMNAGPANKLPK